MNKAHDFEKAAKLISDDEPEKIHTGLSWFSDNIPLLEGDEYRHALQAVASVFTHDTYEFPQYQGVVNKAVGILASQGELSIPYLLEMLNNSDFKVEFNLAVILGRIGATAVSPLIEAFNHSHHSAEKAFIIYALGKIDDAAISKAIPVVLVALDDEDREVRDSAARALGKISENLKSDSIPPNIKNKIFDKLLPKTKDEYSGVRSKAIRSLGRLSKNGFLTGAQTHQLKTALIEILGRSGDFIWDSAFIVRREAEAVYRQLSGDESGVG